LGIFFFLLFSFRVASLAIARKLRHIAFDLWCGSSRAKRWKPGRPGPTEGNFDV